MFNLLLRPIDTGTLLIIIAIVAVLAIIFGALIVLVSKICFVKEDERISKTADLLAGANCGGCGYAGCADYARALAEGKATLCDCNATSNDAKEKIAQILGVTFCASNPQIAVVKCAGGINAKDKFDYVGNSGCDNQILVLGGKKLCSNACLGDGSCSAVCPENGISVVDGVAVVDKSLCGACGACVKKCPKNLIELIPQTAKVYVACSSACRGKDVMNACSVGCIGCGLCAKNCPANAITMENNLPVIDYSKCNGCLTCVSKCPRKIIKTL